LNASSQTAWTRDVFLSGLFTGGSESGSHFEAIAACAGVLEDREDQSYDPGCKEQPVPQGGQRGSGRRSPAAGAGQNRRSYDEPEHRDQNPEKHHLQDNV
jgi:hypothetical protein